MTRSLSAILTAVCGLFCTTTVAQESSVPPAPTPSRIPAEKEAGRVPLNGLPSQTENDSAVTKLLRDLIYLPGPDGKLVPVPLDVTLEQYLNATREKVPNEPTTPTLAAVSSVVISGVADEERANFECRLEIQVTAANAWVRLPLGFQDAVLQASKYQGPGEQTFGGFDREAGHRWWFKGQGLHELTLSLSAPIRRQGSTRRVQLSLPGAATSSLTLTVPGQATGTKVQPEGAWVRTKLKETTSLLEVRGLSSRCDLSWQPVSSEDQIQTVLQSEMSITLDIAEESLILEADQAIEALEGSFQEVRVRLPRGFELLDVEERTGRLLSTRIEDPANPDFLVIRFTEPTKGPVLLHWTLEGAFATGTPRVSIEGFEVERAVRQSGEILIASIDGYRLSRRDGDDRFVHRIQPRQKASGRPWSSAWRFLKQPFRLVMDVQELQPYFTVEPRWQVNVRSSVVELDGQLLVHVAKDRGSVQRILLNWPGWKQDGWLPQVDDKATSSIRVETEDPALDGKIRLQLESRKSGTFEIPFKARRVLPSGPSMLELTIPHAESSARSPALLEFRCDENLETDVFRILPTSLAEANRPANWSRSWKFRIEDENPRFSVRTTTHSREVRYESTSDAVIRADRLQVAQRFHFQVKYESISQLHLRIPSELSGKVIVTWNEDEVLSTSIVRDETSSRTSMRITLPKPELGRFTLVARFIADAVSTGEGEKRIRLPILQIDDATVSATRIRVPQENHAEWDVRSGDFQLGQSEGSWTNFVASGPRNEAQLALSSVEQRHGRVTIVDRAWCRTRIDEAGSVFGTLWMRVQNPINPLRMIMPAGLEFSSASWEDVEAEVHDVSSNESSGRILAVQPPEEGSSQRMLRVEYQTSHLVSVGALRTARMRFPEFDSSIQIQQNVWEIELPAGRHLFENPKGYAPAFQWQRMFLSFQRIAAQPFQSVEQWIPEASTTGESQGEFSNRYPFVRVGSLEPADFSLITFPMLVLLGAGAAWLSGLVLLKTPIARNTMALLTLALIVVLFGFAFPSAVATMAQPAVVGLCLAGLMAGLETLMHRKPRSPVLTLSPPSESNRLVGKGSSIRQHIPLVQEELSGRREHSISAGSSPGRAAK